VVWLPVDGKMPMDSDQEKKKADRILVKGKKVHVQKKPGGKVSQFKDG